MDSIENELEAAEPIWLTVAQLSAGFHRLDQLSRELVELDGVRLDVANTRAMIRRDIAGAVLKTATALKKMQSETVDAVAAPLGVSNDQSAPQQDEWANRLVRWADQFGRDLFRLPNLLLPSHKRDDDPKTGPRK